MLTIWSGSLHIRTFSIDISGKGLTDQTLIVLSNSCVLRNLPNLTDSLNSENSIFINFQCGSIIGWVWLKIARRKSRLRIGRVCIFEPIQARGDVLIIATREVGAAGAKHRKNGIQTTQLRRDKIYNQSILMIKTVLIGLLVCALAFAAPVEEEVHLAIPGYTQHKWYSGYLNFTDGEDTGAFHYVFFDSQHDPDNDPLVLWLNGGPGCSSLIGMVYENGPFVFKPNTTTFMINQFAWNKKANLLYITSPQGVGFSVGQAKSLNDNSVAIYNLKAMLAFFQKFPNLKKNDFYMTGESYAGIYVPYLANQIIKFNKLPSSREKVIKLKGIMVGNACTDPDECFTPGDGLSMFQYEFLYKHTYLSDQQYELIQARCTLGYHSEGCMQVRDIQDKKFMETKTSILNIYSPCYHQKINKTRKLRQSGRFTTVNIDEGSCDDSLGIHHFFNEPTMFEHLHVNPIHFEQCSDNVALHYIMNSNASIWIYPILHKEGLRIWVYSGDVDADVPITGTLRWLERFKEEHGIPVMEPWRQWWVPGLHKHEDQVGGMTWELNGLTFASIKGAGHEVPRDKKKEAFTLISSFLNGESLPQKSE